MNQKLQTQQSQIGDLERQVSEALSLRTIVGEDEKPDPKKLQMTENELSFLLSDLQEAKKRIKVLETEELHRKK